MCIDPSEKAQHHRRRGLITSRSRLYSNIVKRSPRIDRILACLLAWEDSQKETESNFKIESILFDLDDTLYPLSSGIAAACRKNIEEFMVEKLGIDKSLVPELCSQLYKTHGTTMAGLRVAGYQFSFDDFHNFAHGRLPYDILQPDRELQKILLNLPQRKYIFTNADRNHALKVLSRLGIKDCFDGIISFETIMEHPEFAPHTSSEGEHGNGVLEDVNSQVICKPSSEAMRRAINIAQVEPSRTLYCDDSARNIAAGKEAGFHTVLNVSTKFGLQRQSFEPAQT